MKLAAFVFALLLSACGDNKNSATPAAPTPVAPAAPTVTGLSIVGSRTFRTGQTETMRAEVMLSNGTSQAAANSTWNSSNALVATVSDGGVVAAVGCERHAGTWILHGTDARRHF